MRFPGMTMEKLRDLLAVFHEHCKEWGYRTIAVTLVAVAALTLNFYVPQTWLTRIVEGHIVLSRFESSILASAGFCLQNFITLFLFPFLSMAIIIFWGKRRGGTGHNFPSCLRDTGTGWGDQTRFLWVFAAAFAALLPLIWWAGQEEAYQTTYPFFFYARFGVQYLALWWLFYGLYYIGVEYFFRGFLLFGLEARFGSSAVLISVIPYVMIHFSKPATEVIGSALAGILLGYMALRSRSIWGGFFLHWLVGMAMDAMSIYYGSGFMSR